MKLVFVYNADSGFMDKLLDNVHKIVSPSTYDCNLCAITHGKFVEDNLWKSYRESSKTEMAFLHKDEFLETYKEVSAAYEFPAVLMEDNEQLNVFIDASALNEMTTSEELIEEISRRSR